MTTATQHISPNPALDFAKGILEETNGALELIEILRDIADGVDEKATTNDRIAANTVLLDRGLGKCPKQPPVLSQACPEPNRRVEGPAPGPNPNPAPETNTKEPIAHDEPESPRLVTQIDNSLNQSIGPAPSVHTEPALGLPKGQSTDLPHSAEHDISESPASFNPYSIHLTIQQHILAITNNGQTIRQNLLEIARAEDDPKACPEQEPVLSPVEGPVLSKAEGGRRITTYHRRRAAILLIDRVLGTDPNALRSAVCPECRQRWTTHPDSSAHPEPVEGDSTSDSTSEEFVPDPKWVAALHEIKRMEDEGILTPDPNARKFDLSFYMPPEDYKFDPAEVKARVAEFDAKLELQAERRAKWPEIEERRRKKLAQIYPSHSKDDDPPDT